MQSLATWLLNAAPTFLGTSNKWIALILAVTGGLILLVLWHRSENKKGNAGVEANTVIIAALIIIGLCSFTIAGAIYTQQKKSKTNHDENQTKLLSPTYAVLSPTDQAVLNRASLIGKVYYLQEEAKVFDILSNEYERHSKAITQFYLDTPNGISTIRHGMVVGPHTQDRDTTRCRDKLSAMASRDLGKVDDLKSHPNFIANQNTPAPNDMTILDEGHRSIYRRETDRHLTSMRTVDAWRREYRKLIEDTKRELEMEIGI